MKYGVWMKITYPVLLATTDSKARADWCVKTLRRAAENTVMQNSHEFIVLANEVTYYMEEVPDD